MSDEFYDAEADGLRLFAEAKENAEREAVNELVGLSAGLFLISRELSSEMGPNGEDSDRGNTQNLADALQCLSFMEPDDAAAHARKHLPALVERVRPALEREGFDGAELARELSSEMGNLGE